MKLCKKVIVRVCLFLLAAVPAYCQRSTFGIDVGQTSDRFGALPRVSGLEFDIDGQLTVLHSNPKTGWPAIVAGGEIDLPTDTGNHAKEYAVYGGPVFQFHNLSIGVNGQVRKIYLPPSTVDNQFFVRNKMELLEIPIVLKYTFGQSKRAFIQVQGAPEFSPHWKSGGSLVALPNPNFDHGYFIRGSAGYDFGRWYAKATYQTRYFRFIENAGNPTNLYSWRSDKIMGGIGISF